jgi:hypothetical protein
LEGAMARYYPGTLFRCISNRGDFVFEIIGPGRSPLYKLCRVIYDDSTNRRLSTFESEYSHKHLNKYGKRMNFQESSWKSMKVSVDELLSQIDALYLEANATGKQAGYDNYGTPGYYTIVKKIYALKDERARLLIEMSKLKGVDENGNAL